MLFLQEFEEQIMILILRYNHFKKIYLFEYATKNKLEQSDSTLN